MGKSRKRLWLLAGLAAVAVTVPSLLCCVRSPGFRALTGQEPTRGRTGRTSQPIRSDSAGRPPIGTNLADPTYWSASHPFVDAMKAADRFISGRPGHPDERKRWDDGATLRLDERGWVRSLEPGQVARVFILGGDTTYPTGKYTVLYEGQGEIEYQGRVRNLTRAPGKDTFDLGARGGLFLNLKRIDGSDPLRNIRVLLPGGRCEDDGYKACSEDASCGGTRCVPFEENYEEAPFHPTFLSDIREFGTLRFMDWMRTNRERDLRDGVEEPLPIRTFDEYPGRTRAQWHPVPIEIMVDLANTVGAHPWFTMPHAVDDAFVRQFAEAVRERLDPGLKVYVEYSNEHWNDIFDQHQWTNAQGCRAESDSPRQECDPNGDGTLCEYTSWNRFQEKCAEYGSRFFARRTVQVMRIWEQAFGAEQRERLVRVFGGQIGAAEWRGRPQLELVVDGSPVYEQVDAYAVAPYFGGGATLGSVDDAFRTVDEETHDAPAGTYRLLSGEPDSDDGGLYRWIATDVETLTDSSLGNLDLIAYEGGQHFHNHDESMMERMHAANRDPRMKDLYAAFLTMWFDLTGGANFVHFTSPSAWGRFGAWGSKEFQGQPRAEAPKHDALLEAIERSHSAEQSSSTADSEPTE